MKFKRYSELSQEEINLLAENRCPECGKKMKIQYPDTGKDLHICPECELEILEKVV